MKNRYVVVDEFDRTTFEKEWQMPYGYGKALLITLDPKEAIEFLEDMPEVNASTVIIEKVSEYGTEFYYRK